MKIVGVRSEHIRANRAPACAATIEPDGILQGALGATRDVSAASEIIVGQRRVIALWAVTRCARCARCARRARDLSGRARCDARTAARLDHSAAARAIAAIWLPALL